MLSPYPARGGCPRCGKKNLSPNEQYCGWCGAPLPAPCPTCSVEAEKIEAFKQQSQKKNAGKGVVYLIRGDSYYKIGKTIDPNIRMTQIRLQMPFPIELIHTIKTDNIDWLESHWHKHFAQKRVNGEWFKLSDQDVKDFMSMKQALMSE